MNLSKRDKRARLDALAIEVRDLKESPLYKYRLDNNYHPVIGEGNPSARVMFIGEAPGKHEAKSGRPFVGRSGKVLDELIKSIGLSRDSVYITNVVKDRPPDNRDPTKEEVRLYAPFLDRQIEIIRPEVIIPLGRFAMDFILARFELPQYGEKISALHGGVLKARADYGEIAVIPMFHPAIALYNPGRKDTLRQDFRSLLPILC